jgi:phenylpropionate dioxygenase-like ring-hydroxylating dioxygenase large terminal subunit
VLKEENELITRVGPGTPMGALMRHYWIPGLLSSELPAPNSDPVRVRLLGEDLIAFRDSDGQVGMLGNHCPHRGASLFYGRNEENGLRCVYHGWKYDVSGQCVDMPSEPPESTFKERIRATAYPCRERGGVVWTYMGPRQEPPPLPDLEANMLPADESFVGMVARDCNWLQGLEGDIDTSHLQILHYGSMPAETEQKGTFGYYGLQDRAPRFAVTETDYGTMYGAYRPADEENYYWRIASYLFPFYVMIPTGLLGHQILVRAWVPIDDTHMMFVSMGSSRPGRSPGAGISRSGVGYLPNTTDWLGRWRITQNAANDYLIDREKQRRLESYTGIPGILQQDQAVTESMGPIYDRTEEHLAHTDAMVFRTRLRLLNAVRSLSEGGTVPPGVDQPDLYAQRSGGVILPREADWIEATRELRQAFVDHPELDPAVVGANA